MPRLQPEAEEAARLKWNRWRQDEVTQDFFNFLVSKVNSKAADWAEGMFNGSDLHSFVAQNATAQGAVTVMKEMLNLEFSDVYQIEGQENDGEQQQQERDSSHRGSRAYLPRRD